MRKKLIVMLMTVFLLPSVLFAGVSCTEKTTTNQTEQSTTIAETTIEQTSTASEESTTIVAASEDQTDFQKGEGLIFYLAPTLIDEFQNASKMLIEQKGKELGYDVKTLNANTQAATQMNQMDDAISQNPKAIFLAAVDAPTIISSVEKAQKEGIKVLAYDRPLTDGKADLTSTLGLKKMGEIAAQEVVTLLKEKNGSEKGKVFQVMGDPGDFYSVLIGEGFNEYLKQYPDIIITTKSVPAWETTVAASTIDDGLTAEKDYDILFMHGDFWMPAIEPVLTSHNYKPGDLKVIGTAGQPMTFEYIKNGWMTANVDVPTFQEVDGLYLYLDELLAGEEIKAANIKVNNIDGEVVIEKWGPVIYWSTHIITKENVDDPANWGNMKIEIPES